LLRYVVRLSWFRAKRDLCAEQIREQVRVEKSRDNDPSFSVCPITKGTFEVCPFRIRCNGSENKVTLPRVFNWRESLARRQKTYLSTRPPQVPLEAPFVKVRIVDAGTCLRHARRSTPGDCLHPTADAMALKFAKDGVGDVDSTVPDSIIAAWKGAVPAGCLTYAAATDVAPAD
jgi:hypothetical protein